MLFDLGSLSVLFFNNIHHNYNISDKLTFKSVKNVNIWLLMFCLIGH